MKLRICGNSLRLRLTRMETAGLAATGIVEDWVQLGGQLECSLVYRLGLSDTVARPVATFRGSQLCVRVPELEGRDWVRNDTVGIYAEESRGLKLIAEKDFKCLDPRLGEDESDAFEKPGGFTHAGCAAASD